MQIMFKHVKKPLTTNTSSWECAYKLHPLARKALYYEDSRVNIASICVRYHVEELCEVTEFDDNKTHEEHEKHDSTAMHDGPSAFGNSRRLPTEDNVDEAIDAEDNICERDFATIGIDNKVNTMTEKARRRIKKSLSAITGNDKADYAEEVAAGKFSLLKKKKSMKSRALRKVRTPEAATTTRKVNSGKIVSSKRSEEQLKSLESDNFLQELDANVFEDIRQVSSPKNNINIAVEKENEMDKGAIGVTRSEEDSNRKARPTAAVDNEFSTDDDYDHVTDANYYEQDDDSEGDSRVGPFFASNSPSTKNINKRKNSAEWQQFTRRVKEDFSGSSEKRETVTDTPSSKELLTDLLGPSSPVAWVLNDKVETECQSSVDAEDDYIEQNFTKKELEIMDSNKKKKRRLFKEPSFREMIEVDCASLDYFPTDYSAMDEDNCVNTEASQEQSQEDQHCYQESLSDTEIVVKVQKAVREDKPRIRDSAEGRTKFDSRDKKDLLSSESQFFRKRGHNSTNADTKPVATESIQNDAVVIDVDSDDHVDSNAKANDDVVETDSSVESVEFKLSSQIRPTSNKRNRNRKSIIQSDDSGSDSNDSESGEDSRLSQLEGQELDDYLDYVDKKKKAKKRQLKNSQKNSSQTSDKKSTRGRKIGTYFHKKSVDSNESGTKKTRNCDVIDLSREDDIPKPIYSIFRETKTSQRPTKKSYTDSSTEG